MAIGARAPRDFVAAAEAAGVPAERQAEAERCARRQRPLTRAAGMEEAEHERRAALRVVEAARQAVAVAGRRGREGTAGDLRMHTREGSVSGTRASSGGQGVRAFAYRR